MVTSEVPFSKDKVLRKSPGLCVGLCRSSKPPPHPLPLALWGRHVPLLIINFMCSPLDRWQQPLLVRLRSYLGLNPKFLQWSSRTLSAEGSPGVAQPGSSIDKKKSMLGSHSGVVALGLQPDPHPLQGSHGGYYPCLSSQGGTRSSLGTASDVSQGL